MEALQFLKCWYRQDLLFHEPPPTSKLELSMLVSEANGMSDALEDKGKVVPEESRSWDELIIDGDDEEDPEIFDVV